MEQAGFLKRFLAYMIDYFILNTAVGIIGFIITLPLAFYFGYLGYSEDLAMGLIYLIVLPICALIGILYYAIMESSKLQGTVGKYAMKLAVVDKDGNRISFWRAFGRAIFMLFSMFTLGIGWLMILWTKNKQSLHDKMSGCFVVLKEEKTEEKN